MCGIIGIFGENSKIQVEKSLELLKNRGKDNQDIYEGDNFTLGHTLHSVVGFTKQPITGRGILTANCEIYNWKELGNEESDSKVLFNLLENNEIEEVLKKLDGVFAFAYYKDNQIYLARDIIGIKPLWYTHTDTFAFASEKKVLENLGYLNIQELNPREILIYNKEEDKITIKKRKFFTIKPENQDSKEIILKDLENYFLNAIKKRIPSKKFGVLFSGGIDSTILSHIIKNNGHNFTCYLSVFDDPDLKEPEDLTYAQEIAKELNFNLEIVKIKLDEVESLLKTIVPLIEDSNVVKVGVALTFYAACKKAKEDGCKVIFSGLGSEEIFAGYERHKNSRNANEECISGLLKMYERDTYRDDVITMFNELELRLPFLDKELVNYALKIPEKYKINEEQSKIILRDLAIKLKLPERFSQRKKRAAQYGSNFHKALKKLTKKENHKFISSYLKQFYPQKNLKLAALVSSGKDGIYAMYTMMKQNYEISCMITIKSKNLDSYMYHTPAVDIVKLQSESTGIPLMIQETEGEKEKELEDLKIILKEAKEKYQIDGIITGALFSNYQRERIEKVADSLSLKIFSPLWHMNQETEVREIINKERES